MKLKYIIGCLLLMLGLRALAQEWPKNMISLKDLYTLEVPTVDISDARVLDTATLSIKYCFTYQIDREVPQKSTWVTLDVGRDYVKFYCDDYFRSDSMYSYQIKSLFSSYSCKHIPCEEILYKSSSSKITVYNRIINGSTPLVSYVEEAPQIDWKISESETQQIAGYTCHCAKGVYGGREWIVWFTLDIPVAYGPWKLHGLPGIILRAQESKGCYQFESVWILSQPKPILMYACKILNIEKTEWRKLDEKMFSSPLETMAKDKDTWVYYKKMRLDESWKIPYNPIELE